MICVAQFGAWGPGSPWETQKKRDTTVEPQRGCSRCQSLGKITKALIHTVELNQSSVSALPVAALERAQHQSVPSCTLINLGCQGRGGAGWQEMMLWRQPGSSHNLVMVVHVRMSAWTSLFRGYIHIYCSIFLSGSPKEEQESLLRSRIHQFRWSVMLKSMLNLGHRDTTQFKWVCRCPFSLQNKGLLTVLGDC